MSVYVVPHEGKWLVVGPHPSIEGEVVALACENEAHAYSVGHLLNDMQKAKEGAQ